MLYLTHRGFSARQAVETHSMNLRTTAQDRFEELSQNVSIHQEYITIPTGHYTFVLLNPHIKIPDPNEMLIK